ncbi:DUF2507 domain-containing protein [Saliterribacillus persicus]|uniref:Uncharacterized protein DUF2507 n=1 Tax=Saliterribacillus persicus TaxID=930114 RepID=A0A368XIQ8_9BACI|nr:DUF2507 domain-containing protein [Saliterribacillus persicus]RCW66357.1 uncharacterized protein DUF2507 [Saliterribacillus persicus]
MSKNNASIPTILTNLESTGAGNDLLRYVALPDLLGEELDLMMYILGKNIGRKAECQSMEEVVQLFHDSNWGNLIYEKEKRRGFTFLLEGDIIRKRIETIDNVEFRLESGFLAETMSRLHDQSCECRTIIKKDHVELEVLYSK